ncbi:hypothetical protein FOA52_004890 [Chlamydomonas sp. UWO 241]|nr:hypothetical protein FOA52_004890 [Chlamydomonas sp. UWO 241]
MLISTTMTRWLCTHPGVVYVVTLLPYQLHLPAIAAGIMLWTRTEEMLYWVVPWRTLGAALLPAEGSAAPPIYHYLLHAAVYVWLCAGPELVGAPFTSLREYLVVHVPMEALQMVSLLAIDAQGYANLGLGPLQRAIERILIGAAVFLLKLWWTRGRSGSDTGSIVSIALSAVPAMRMLPLDSPTEAPDRQDRGGKHAADHQIGGGGAAASDAGVLCDSSSDRGLLCDGLGGMRTLLTAPTALLRHGTTAMIKTSEAAADASLAHDCASSRACSSTTAVGVLSSCVDTTGAASLGGFTIVERKTSSVGLSAGGESLPLSCDAEHTRGCFELTTAAADNVVTASLAALTSLAKAVRGGGPTLTPAADVAVPGQARTPPVPPAAHPAAAVALPAAQSTTALALPQSGAGAGVESTEGARMSADALRTYTKRLMSTRPTFVPSRTRVRVSIKIPDAEPENLAPGWMQILASHVARAHVDGGVGVVCGGGGGGGGDGGGDGGSARLVATYVMRGCTQLILDISIDAAAAVAAAFGSGRAGGGGGGGGGGGPDVLGRASSVEFIGGASSAAMHVYALSQAQQAWLGKCLFDADVMQGRPLAGTVQLRGGLLPGWCGECVEPHPGSLHAVCVPGVALAPGTSDVVHLPPAAKMQQVTRTREEGGSTAASEALPQLLSLPLRLSGRLPPGTGLHARLSGAFVPIVRLLCAACRESVDKCACKGAFSGGSSSQHMLEPLALGGPVDLDPARDTTEGAAADTHTIASAAASTATAVSASVLVSVPLAKARAALALPPSPTDPDQCRDHSHGIPFGATTQQPARNENEPAYVLASTPVAWSEFVGEGVESVDVVVELELPGGGLACGVLMVEAVHAGSGALGLPFSLALLPCPAAASELSSALASADPSDAPMMADFAAELARWLGAPDGTEAMSPSHSVVASGDALLRYALHCGLPVVATLLLDRLAATLAPATHLPPGHLPAAAQLPPSCHAGALLSALLHALPSTASGDAADDDSAAMTHLHLAVASGCPAVVAALAAATRAHGVALDWAVPGGGGVTPLHLAAMLLGGCALLTGGADAGECARATAAWLSKHNSTNATPEMPHAPARAEASSLEVTATPEDAPPLFASKSELEEGKPDRTAAANATGATGGAGDATGATEDVLSLFASDTESEERGGPDGASAATGSAAAVTAVTGSAADSATGAADTATGAADSADSAQLASLSTQPPQPAGLLHAPRQPGLRKSGDLDVHGTPSLRSPQCVTTPPPCDSARHQLGALTATPGTVRPCPAITVADADADADCPPYNRPPPLWCRAVFIICTVKLAGFLMEGEGVAALNMALLVLPYGLSILADNTRVFSRLPRVLRGLDACAASRIYRVLLHIAAVASGINPIPRAQDHLKHGGDIATLLAWSWFEQPRSSAMGAAFALLVELPSSSLFYWHALACCGQGTDAPRVQRPMCWAASRPERSAGVAETHAGVAALVVDAMERGRRHLWRITRPHDGQCFFDWAVYCLRRFLGGNN